MSYQMPGAPGPNYIPPPAPVPPARKRWTAGRILALLAAVIVMLFVAAITLGGQSKPHAHPGSNEPPGTVLTNPGQGTSAPPPVAAAPDPKGTYQGSCDYTLGSDPVGGTAVAIGEVDLNNTGNIGTVDHVRITWPQEGYAPLVETRVVRNKAGNNLAVRFHRPINQDEIDRLQSWQTNHDYKDGCTYKVVITSTFGQAQS